jgi:hypothetical protein
MPYNLLLFPLLGGFVFVSKCSFFRHKILRYDNQRLIFASALAGAACLFASFALVKFCNTYYPWMKQLYTASKLIPFDYAPTTIGAFLLGCVIWRPINWLYTEEEAIRHTIVRNQDPLEILLLTAFESQTQAMFTLKNGKVYIGWVTEVPNPVIAKHIKITPSLSGYRDKDTKEFTATTDYSKALKRARLSNYEKMSINDFVVILPVAELQNVSKFNSEVFTFFAGENIAASEEETITISSTVEEIPTFSKKSIFLKYCIATMYIPLFCYHVLQALNLAGTLALNMIPATIMNFLSLFGYFCLCSFWIYSLRGYVHWANDMRLSNKRAAKTSP